MIRCRSFTLFELLLAILLLGMLVFTLLPAANRVMASSASASQRSQQLFRLALLSDIIDRSMMTLLAVDAKGQPGFELSQSGIILTSCGVSLAVDGDYPDIQTIEIKYSSGAISIRERGGSWHSLVGGVSRVEFLLHDGEDWQGSSSENSTVPKAFAVSVWFGSEPSDDNEDPQFDLAGSDAQDDDDPDWRRVFAVFDPVDGDLDGASR
ncbi:MAG: hypothetical protein Phyf2KO_03680 [Phycisphaerales bacterium]